DGAESEPGRRDPVQHAGHQIGEGLPPVAAVGPEVHSGEDDLPVSIGHRLLGAADDRLIRLAARGAPGSPHDAIRAPMVAAILHLEEEARARVAAGTGPGARQDGADDVDDYFILFSVLARYVGSVQVITQRACAA